MHSQDAIGSATTTKVMDRMRALGNITVKAGDRRRADQEIVHKLDIDSIAEEEVIEGFFHLVEEGKIRGKMISLDIGSGGLLDYGLNYEDVVIYSLV